MDKDGKLFVYTSIVSPNSGRIYTYDAGYAANTKTLFADGFVVEINVNTPNDIAITEDNRIFVSDWNSGIYQLSQSPKSMCQIPTP